MVENLIKKRGGARPGSGRPKGSKTGAKRKYERDIKPGASNQQFVYVYGDISNEINEKCFWKIGMTTNIKNREKALNVGPVEQCMWAAFPTYKARKLEQFIHFSMKRDSVKSIKHIKGEWFEGKLSIIVQIIVNNLK